MENYDGAGMNHEGRSEGHGGSAVDLNDTQHAMAADDERELAELKTGGQQALADSFSHHQKRLRKMVAFRLDPRLWGRVDPADILQESYLQASQRLAGFLRNPAVPVFIWLRLITTQVLADVHRRHLARKKRDARLEVPLHGKRGGQGTSISLAAHLIDDVTSPSGAAMREEMQAELYEALDGMDPIDREVLALRHFEDLTNGEVAQVLGLQKSAASNRYVRALKRLRLILKESPTFREQD